MRAATKAAVDWWSQSRGAESGAWIENYKTSLEARHRLAISRIVGDLKPRTLLEVGCHCGPNLVRIALDHPTVKCAGIDPSAEAIAAGRAWVQSLDLHRRIGFNEGAFPLGTEALPSGGVDVVLSCYTIGYLEPDDLDDALYEMGRLASQAVILAEPMDGPGRYTLGGYQEWHHPYLERQKWIGTLRDRKVAIVGVDPPVDALSQILVLS